jgi:hypothetical protein
MMMLDKTKEELKRELTNAKAMASYHKNKHKHKPKTRREGESPRAKQNRLRANIDWNDTKHAMVKVISTLTTDSEEEANAEAVTISALSIEEIRELAKGYEDKVAEEIAVRRKERAERLAKEQQQAQVIAKAEKVTEVSNHPPAPTVPKQPSKSMVDNLEKAQKIASKRLGFSITKEQTLEHVLSMFLQNDK